MVLKGAVLGPGNPKLLTPDSDIRAYHSTASYLVSVEVGGTQALLRALSGQESTLAVVVSTRLPSRTSVNKGKR